MSADFDPTKLDLDINSEENTTDIQKNRAPEKDTEQKNDDILSDISIPEVKTNDILDEIDVSETEIKQQDTQEEKTSSLGNNIPEQKIATAHNTEKKLIDINISSLDELILLLDEKKYDFVTLEPEDMQVKVVFRQDNVEREIKYIKFPIYTSILFKTKQVTSLTLDETSKTQEGKGKIKVSGRTFAISSKTAPGQNGEKIWIKAHKVQEVEGKKTTNKTSIGKIFGFLGAILFIALILFGVFIGFVVFNANDVRDVEFFRSLGINLNDINIFIGNIVSIIFSILLFIVTLALSFALFKFLTTKKSLKRKKVVYGILSAFLLILTIGVGSTWMIIYEKVQSLPNWLEKERGNLEIFDNTLLISDDFTEDDAYMNDIENLIAPITLKFDLSNFESDKSNQIYNIKKYIWEFGEERFETFSPEIIQTFNEIGNYETIITVEGENSRGEPVTQIISDNATISVSHKVEINETLTNNGGKKYEFDAGNLENIGEVSWYIYEPTTQTNPQPTYKDWTKVADGYDFFPRKIFFEEAYIGIAIINGTKNEESLDKIIRISSEGSSEITGEITFEQSLENELTFDFFVTNPETGFANGFIESYQWKIEDKTYNVSGDIDNTDISEKISHTFESFGEQSIEVTLTDSTGKSETLTKVITIQKQVQLKSSLSITNGGEEIENMKYEKNTHEYFIDNLGIPTTIKLDARYVRAENSLYSLKTVSWDIGGDENIDAEGKVYEYLVPTDGNHSIVANYIFEHRRDANDIITMKEFIYIEGVKKEAILDLKIESPSNYVPVTVRFDASSSFIKNEDIIKFIYDYGDGTQPEERDSINPGHKYTKAGDYTIKLTVVGESGKTYSIEKSLILLPVPQEVKITSSLKRAPTGQGIDFSSAGSSGQIVEYFWDFGDGEISTDANPTHSFSKPGIYKVKLRGDFVNSNSITDEIEIEIFNTEE